MRLRDDLVFHLQTYGDRPCYVIEDEPNGRFYRIGLPEYTFLSLLDGRTSVGAALAHTATVTGAEALSESRAAALCQWLVESDLAETWRKLPACDGSGKSRRPASRMLTPLWLALNPLLIRVPLGDPSRLFRLLLPLCGGLFSGLGAAVWCVTVAAALGTLLANWQRIVGDTRQIVAPHNWLWLAATWLALKIVHESAHGLVCTRFGGRVREGGVQFLLGVPLPYVDVTSSWRLSSKWQRMFIAAAGVYAELFVAAVATLVASRTSHELLRQHCLAVMFTAGVVTLLFNANPLMRFDGYYLLADWLELPNLSTHGQQYVIYLAKRHLLGLPVRPPQWPEGRDRFVRLYGIAALAWRLVTCVGLLVAAGAMFHGAGLILAVVGGLLWFGWPAVRFGRYLLRGTPTEQPRRGRFLAIVATASLAGYYALTTIPYVETIQAPAIVEFAEPTTIRTPVAGFVREIRIAPGEAVVAGQTLFVLENRELLAQLAELRVAHKKTQLRARQFQQEGNLAAWQVELQHGDSLAAQIRERAEQAAQLVITAPHSGRVIAADLASLQATYVHAGASLLELAPANHEFRAVLSQDHHAAIQSSPPSAVRIYVDGLDGVLVGRIKAIRPRATTQLPHLALAATASGPLPVRSTAASPRPTLNTADRPAPTWELLDPHFVVEITLSSAPLPPLGAGQLATVTFRASRETLSTVACDYLSRWIVRRPNQP